MKKEPGISNAPGRNINKAYRLLAGMLLCLLMLVGAGAQTAQAKNAPGSKVFRYVALGNSVTSHPVCDFWFYECGMAASKPSKDYVHQTISRLKKKYGSAYRSYKYLLPDYALWELSSMDRAALKKELKKILKKDVQLLTFQYGDNVRNASWFEAALKDLITFVQKRSPDTKIIILGNTDLSSAVNRRVEALKKKVAKACGVGFADLSPIVKNAKYRLGYTKLKDSHGQWHQVTMESVARHPNDRGMALIAARIMKAYRNLNR